MLDFIRKLIPRRIFRALQPAYHFILNWLAALVYGFPARRLIVIGVTGTAGKTSVVYLTAKMLGAAGYKTGFTSTAVFSDGDKEWLNDKKMTMPGRFFTQRFLRRLVRQGGRYAIIETTSEGIKQFRHRFIDYDSLIFTGLYPEHIEAHGGFEKYRAAKGELFRRLKLSWPKNINGKPIVKTIIANGDDENAGYFLNFESEAKMIFGQAAGADVRIGEVVAGSARTAVVLNDQKINLHLLGAFNAYNAAAAYAVGLNQGLSPEIIKSGLESVSGLAGKMEIINGGQDFTALVDYSFEPQALAKLYETATLIPHQRIIHVLGSTGGGRDKSRRRILGRLAGEQADIVVVTNEDPYDENPLEIIDQVAAGAEEAGKKLGINLFKVDDRRQAIKKALILAKKHDLVLFTGKGAEQHICLAGGKKMPWDEREVVRQEIQALDKPSERA